MGIQLSNHKKKFFKNMSIPPPGVPRTIPDINQSVLESLKEVMDDDSSLEDNKSTLLGDELASKLSEPKTEDPILTNRNSSSRDNSIIIIKVLIGIIVYDLDVELNILICAVAFNTSLFD